VSITVSWTFDPSVPITEFELSKSADGETWASLATIAYSLSGPNYNRNKKAFEYVDVSGSPGEVYKIVSIGDNGTSEPTYLIAGGYNLEKCTVVGYLVDTVGGVDTDTPIRVSSAPVDESRWLHNDGGVFSQNSSSVGVLSHYTTVYPNAEGIWQVTLIQGTVALVEIPSLQYQHAFEVPKKSLVNIRDIPQIRGRDLNGIFPNMQGLPANIPRG